MRIPGEEIIKDKNLYMQHGFYIAILSKYQDDPKIVREAERRIERIKLKIDKQIRRW